MRESKTPDVAVAHAGYGRTNSPSPRPPAPARPASRPAGKPFDHRAHGIAGLAVLHASINGAAPGERRIRLSGSGNTSGSSQGPAPRRAGRIPVAAIGRRRQAGDALEVVFAGRHRSRAGQGQARRRAFDADILGGGDAVVEVHRDGEIVVGRRTRAEIAAAGQRPALQPLQELLDIEARDRAVMADQGRGAVERGGEAERARAGGHQRDPEIAAAGQFV